MMTLDVKYEDEDEYGAGRVDASGFGDSEMTDSMIQRDDPDMPRKRGR